MPPKYLSGSQKRKLQKKNEDMCKSQAGSMLKFIKKVKSNSEEQHHVEEQEQVHLEPDIQVEQEEKEEQEQVHVEPDESEETEVHVEPNANIPKGFHYNIVDIFDPTTWEGLDSGKIKYLVKNGPKRDMSIMFGPTDGNGRRFSTNLYTRTLSNLEKVDRDWLVYSTRVDKIWCFCCKVFRSGAPKGSLDDDGYRDWQHASRSLTNHEVSSYHLACMDKWFDMRIRIKLNETIDKPYINFFNKERDYWKEVLLRIVALVKFLAKHNLAFRGKFEKLYQKGNGNFLGLIEMLEEFDPIIKEHVRKITNDETHVHYLGHNIQNELIQLLGTEIKKEITKRIKAAKYYSIILDCTPDVSHDEQMSLIIRYVKHSSDSVTIEESFLGFLNVKDTTGEGLFKFTFEELKSLGLEIDDMRGQGYDNGANMKGPNKGVQKRFYDINPRAFYTPCGCHSLNLTLCDMANACVKGKSFFGVIQRIYTIFANSINRWQILKDNVKTWSLKSLSQTRWESRVESLKAIKFQLVDVREALLEVGEKDNDAAIASEANSLAEKELGEFEFLVSIVIWYEVLDRVNTVSKKLQSNDMDLDIAIKEINKLIEFFKGYRETGYSKAIDEAKEIATSMGIDPIFPEKRLIRRKKKDGESSSTQDVSFTPEEKFRVNYFLYIVDKALSSLEERFDQFKMYDKLFGFLFPRNLRGIEDKELELSCDLLANALKFEKRLDVVGKELYTELKLFENSQTDEFTNPLDILKRLKALGYFPNATIAYRILLTVPVTVASAERSFSKLKLLKTYLRSTMSQERLSALAIMSIESEILDNIKCEDMINQFAMKNARRAARIMG